MRIKAWIILSALLAAVLPGFGLSDKTGLPERYRKWLDEEVLSIIAPLERDVFLKLQSDRERDLFIEAFWNHRDPTPGTPENEQKTEHYRRIAYADRFFGRETAKPGFLTDRGRIYIILGEPNDIQKFQGHQGLYDCEIWFYQGKAELGLPPGFNLLFFQRRGRGEYKLYSPSQDGPRALMPNSFGSAADFAQAYQELAAIDPALAGVARSLVPGEAAGASGRPSLVSDVLIRKIESFPERRVEENYARKFLRYKDIVEVEYTANYLDSDSLVKVVRDPSGLSFVHYAIEPRRLSLMNYAGKYFTTLRLNGIVIASNGRPVYQFDKTISIEMNEAEREGKNNQPFAIHDLFLLLPGDYKLSLLLKNEASKEFTSVERNLSLPGESPALQVTPPILAYEVLRTDAKDGKIKPFFIGPFQIRCRTTAVFLQKETLSAVFQIFGLNESLRTKGAIRLTFFKDERIFKEKARRIADCADLPTVMEEMPLADFPPARYKIRISILDDGTETFAVEDDFDVTAVSALPKPWVSLRVLPEAGDPFYDRLVGIQLFNLGRLEESKTRLETAFRKEPSEDTAAELGRVYLSLGAYDKIGPLLAPYLSEARPAGYELYAVAGKAFQSLGRYDRAIEVYERAVSHYGVSAGLLNAIGGCSLALGKPDEALAALEKSLSMDAEQPEIRKAVERLKNEKNAGKRD